jgi:uncharacterized protein DUF5906
MRTAVSVSGDHWIGKSLIGNIIGDIYGRDMGDSTRPDNYIALGPKELFGAYNGWRAGKQFIQFDEIGSTDKRIDADYLKSVIDAESVPINPKYGRQYPVRNCAHSYFTSNHADSLFIDASEQRYFIHNSRASELSRQQVTSIMKWREQGGPAKLLRWLLDYKIPNSFNPNSAPETEARLDLADTGLTDLPRFAREIVDDPYGTLIPLFGSRKIDLWDTENIMSAFRKRHPQRDPSDQALGIALRGTRKIWKYDKRVPDSNGKPKRVWVCANFEAWRTAGKDQFAYEYSRHGNAALPKRYPEAGPRKAYVK